MKLTHHLYLWLFLGLLSLSSAAAQQLSAPRPHFLRIQGGLSLPLGKYRAKSWPSNAYYAQSGWSASLQGGYFFSKSFGITASLRRAEHGVDASLLNRRYGFGQESYFEVQPSRYRLSMALLGICYRLPINRLLAWQSSIQIGVMETKVPDKVTLYRIFYFPSSYDTKQKALSLALQIQTELLANVSPRLAALVSLGYVGGNPQLDKTVDMSRVNFNVVSKRNLAQCLNIELGLQYYLQKQ